LAFVTEIVTFIDFLPGGIGHHAANVLPAPALLALYGVAVVLVLEIAYASHFAAFVHRIGQVMFDNFTVHLTFCACALHNSVVSFESGPRPVLDKKETARARLPIESRSWDCNHHSA
jgi:hypothetical protein